MIRRVVIACATMLVLSSALCMPAASASPGSDSAIAIGDSVMLGARWALTKQGIDIVDAKVSRQASSGAGLLATRGAKLPRNVVIHLGTNGDFPASTCREIVDAVGPDRRVFLLTLSVPRKWERANNAKIKRCAQVYPDQVSIIDWQQAANAHPTWLYSDHIHLREAGAKGYARLISQAIGQPVGQASTTPE